ncbi:MULTISPECIES: hypothetical protein [unclassified Myxococcus]|nr:MULTISPECIES: hypothetical protein [unclassified Myxococcus]
MVSLWAMLSLLSIASTLEGGGGARLGLGVVLGLGLGVLFTVGLRKMGDRVFRSIPTDDVLAVPHLRAVRVPTAEQVIARPPVAGVHAWLEE